MLRKYEMPWRPAYEAYSALAWGVAVITMAAIAIATHLPAAPFWYLTLISLAFMVANLQSAWSIWSIKFSMTGKSIDFISGEELKAKVAADPKSIFVGYGFDWKPDHTQRIYELKKVNPEEFYPPEMFLRIKEKLSGKTIGALRRDLPGAPWIHGVEPNEQDLRVPLQNLEGMTCIFGTTGSGKTRMVQVLINSAIHLGYTVIIIDPKNDIDLQQDSKTECVRAGRANDYVMVHLAFPSQSARIDPLKNFNNPAEIATRIASLIPSDNESDPFKAFCWDVINAIDLGLLAIDVKPTLTKIRFYVESGVQELLIQVLARIIEDAKGPDWQKQAVEYVNRFKKRDGNGNIPNREAFPSEIAAGYLAFYEHELVPHGQSNEAAQSLATMYRHDATHFGKMTSNLKPLLSMLCTGELGKLLSPDPNDMDDERLMTDMQSLINSNSVVYIGLDSLSDKTIASSVGSMYLSDLVSACGARYNFGIENPDKKILLVIDEAAQVVNDPLINMLSMGRGAGIQVVCMTQTVANYVARLGSEPKAREMLGNFNNLFALRTIDKMTQDYVTERLGDTYVYSLQTTQGTNSSTEKNVAHFGGTVSERMNETLEAKIPPELLGMLPNWQYLATVSGGRLIKGRVPIVAKD